MSIAAGDRLGPYHIVEWLGAGGMGEVYRARDPRLDRDVAIKLIAGVASDDAHSRRFEAEARTAGQLNHPNVLAVYDTGSHEGIPYIVSELLTGESLARRLRRGPLPLRGAVDCARQMAAGLAAAHERGIVHRDIKPDNVFVTIDGRVKIVDFGVAKRPAEAAQKNVAETETGTVVGSTPYMSPEQIRGEKLDPRSDIFSFGATLYEMLTGTNPFARRTPADTLAAILNEEPAPFGDRFPAALGRIVARCLEKSRDARFQSARDLAFALDVLSQSTVAQGSGGPHNRASWFSAVSVAALIGTVGLALVSLRPASRSSAGALDLLPAAVISPVTDWEGTEAQAAISPDGRFVAFLADRDGEFDIWLSQVGTGEFRNLTPTLPSMNPPGVVLRPFGFSSDGSKIWFSLTGNPGDRKMVMSLLGGNPRAFLGEGDITPSWSPDSSRLAFVNNRNGDPLFVADAAGADAKLVLAPEPGILHNHDPVWSPDGRWLYIVRGREPTDQMDIWRVAAAGGGSERLTTLNAPVNFLAPLDSRTLLYVAQARDRSGPWLWALDLSAQTSRRVSWGLEHFTSIAASRDGRRLVATVARPTDTLWTVPLVERVAADGDVRRYPVATARAHAPRFHDRTLFYIATGANGESLWRSDGSASAEIWRGEDGWLSEPPSVSPDGQRIATVVSRSGQRQLMVASADGTNRRTLAPSLQLQSAAGQSTTDWSLDGRSLYAGGIDRDGPGLFQIDSETGSLTRLASGQATNPIRSPDGKLIVYAGAFVAGRAPLMGVRTDGGPVSMPETTVRQGGYRFLPNGSALAYLPDLQSRNFWLLELGSGRRKQLTNFSDRARLQTFDISPDGREIIFDRARENSDIVLIELPGQASGAR